MSTAFLKKQKAGVHVVSACWIPDPGTDDKPENWNRLAVRMSDGSEYRLKRDFVAANELDWGLST